mgnify:CR=1 FL=1
MTPEQAAAETGDGTASAMVEIGWVRIRYRVIFTFHPWIAPSRCFFSRITPEISIVLPVG